MATGQDNNAGPGGRFISQNVTTEDYLKGQTIGLVQHSDFKKRRAEALKGDVGSSSDGTATPPLKKKKKKPAAKVGKLSFGADDDEGDDSEEIPGSRDRSASASVPPPEAAARKMKANIGGGLPPPKALTKSALAKESAERDRLKREFLQIQDRVKRTPMLVPFVFYDGTAIPAGALKMLKGDPIWLFLDRARKIGAKQDLDVGPQARGKGVSSLKGWARVSVDDLILVQGDIIVPHHYDFYYFILNKSRGSDGRIMFDYDSGVTDDSPAPPAPSDDSEVPAEATLLKPEKKKPGSAPEETVLTEEDKKLEGFGHDAQITKVVDRRWYEKNKHIFPASIWQEFEPGREYDKEIRRDAGGNPYFFA